MAENANIAEKKKLGKREKEELLKALDDLKKEYEKSKETASRQYYVGRLRDFVDSLLDYGYNKEDLKKIYDRLGSVNQYGRIYDYSLAENLKEQKTIITDSIQSSPMHLKKLELQNTAMITLPEVLRK